MRFFSVALFAHIDISQTNKQNISQTNKYTIAQTNKQAAIALAIQVDRGLISYDDKISKYWPEFAQANKENVTVSEWLRHKGGLAWLNTTLSWEVLSDHDAVASIMASQPHIFNGTSNSAYHSLTYGFVVNELIRRTDPLRRTLGQFIREEINEPLGIEFYLGSHDTRVLDRFTSFIPFPVTHIILKLLPQAYVDLPFLEPIPERFKQVTRDLMLSKTNLFTRSTSAIKQESFSDLNRKDLLMHEVGGFNGLSNAQSLAKLAAVMANHGKWEGARFISEKTMQLAHHSYPPEFDHVLLFNLSRTTGGFANWRERIPGAYGWAGYGGSFFIWNPTEKIGFAYVMNAGELDMFGGRGPKLYRAVLDSVLKK